MKWTQKLAVNLWNHFTHSEGYSLLEDLQDVALPQQVKHVHTYPGPSQDYESEQAAQAAAWLREWADAVEGKA